MFDIMGAKFKPTHVIFIYAIFEALKYKKIKIKNIILALFFLILPLLPLYRIVDWQEFFKSYMIWTIIVCYLSVAFQYFYEVFQMNRKKFIKFMVFCISFSQILGVVQFILMNYAGVFFLRDIFGSFQFHINIFEMKSGFYRAYSIFHEPSVFAWVTTTNIAILLYIQRENIFSKKTNVFLQILNFIAILISLSASGMYITILLFGVSILLERSSSKFLFKVTASVILAFVLWKYTIILDPLKRLTTELSLENTSGYERFNSPMQYAKKTLEFYPAYGRGIGQNGYVDSVGMIGLYATANNSIFEIVMNFGMSSIILLLLFMNTFFKRINKNRDYIIIFANLIGILLTTGAYLSLDVLVVLNFTLFLFKDKSHKQNEIQRY